MSNIESVDEMLDTLRVRNMQDFTDDGMARTFDSAKAALTRREERIKVEAQVKLINRLITRLPIDELGEQKYILTLEARRGLLKVVAHLEQQLKTLDGQEWENE